jgi:phosphatidylglycerol:prolipoprotein diacylglycerol transferase
VFLYESLWNLIGFVLIMVAGRKLAGKLKEGDLFLAYLIWYPVGRLWVEALRPDAWKIGSIPTAQIISAVLIVAAVVIFVLRHRRPVQTQPEG